MGEKTIKIFQVDDSEESKDYVGIKVNDGNAEIRIPKFLRLKNLENLEKEDLDLILKFLCSINIAKTLNEERFKKVKDQGNAWPIESYLWIINDYIENGYYFNRDRNYYFDGKGKIEWKRTLRNIPIVSKRKIIYDTLVTSRASSQDGVITEIYKVCLKYSIEKMSWYRNLNIKANVVQTKSISEMVYVVKKEISNTYDDVKRLRFNHMLNILNLADEKDMTINNFTYWINNYYYVYEQMINYMFKGISEKKKKVFNPKGAWEINNYASNPIDSSNLRPDTIFIKNEQEYIEIFVIDAKMYKFGYTADLKDLPETASIQKQITYGDNIKNSEEIQNKYPNAKIRNAFIIPYDIDYFDKNKLNYELEDVTDNIKYVGKAHGKWREVKYDHDNVYTFVIDFNYLLENYKNADNSNIEMLCKKIDEYIERES